LIIHQQVICFILNVRCQPLVGMMIWMTKSYTCFYPFWKAWAESMMCDYTCSSLSAEKLTKLTLYVHLKYLDKIRNLKELYLKDLMIRNFDRKLNLKTRSNLLKESPFKILLIQICLPHGQSITLLKIKEWEVKRKLAIKSLSLIRNEFDTRVLRLV